MQSFWKNAKSAILALVILGVIGLIVVGLFWIIPILIAVVVGLILFVFIRIGFEEIDDKESDP